MILSAITNTPSQKQNSYALMFFSVLKILVWLLIISYLFYSSEIITSIRQILIPFIFACLLGSAVFL